MAKNLLNNKISNIINMADIKELYKEVKLRGGKYTDFNLKAYNSTGAEALYRDFIQNTKTLVEQRIDLSNLYKQVKKLGGSLKSLNLKAYNSKGAKEKYEYFLKRSKAYGADDLTKPQLYKKAKALGYDGPYNRATLATLNKYILLRQKASKRVLLEALRGDKTLKKIKNNPLEELNKLFNERYGFNNYILNNLKDELINKVIFITMKDGSKKGIKITNDNIDRVIEMIKNYGILEVVEGEGSDALSYAQVDNVNTFQIMDPSIRPKYKKNKGRKKASGFFPYLNNSKLDLEKYQIFKNNNESEDMSCIIYTLKQYGIEEHLLKEITLAMNDGVYITNNNLHTIADIIKHRIVVSNYKDNRIRKNEYGKKYGETVEIGCLENHYFINDITQYTKFYIKNMEKIDDYTDSEERYSYTRFYKKDKVKNLVHLNSFNLIRMLLEKGYFVEYRTSIKPSNLYEVQADLTNINENQREFSQPETEPKDMTYFVADIESDVVSYDTHKAIAISVKKIGDVGEPYVYVGEYMFKKFFNKIIDLTPEDSKAVVYFHNAKYDTTLFKGFDVIGEVCKDNTFYSRTYNYYGNFIQIRDSLKYLNTALAKLPSMLKLGKEYEKGEAIGYTYHTEKNILSNEEIRVEEYKAHLKAHEHTIFDKIMGGKTHFNPTKYYLDYLRQDVIVLEKALIKFRALIKEITGLDAFDSLTISSIGHKYAVKYGCYKGVYETNGCLREFIQQAVKGGRVYVNPKYKGKVIKEVLQDFDGVSLYPSAMNRLCEKHGIAMGKIYKGTKDIKDYRDKSYYIVRILVNSVNRNCQVPHIGIKDDKGILKYTNNVRDVELYVDKYTLEDLENYQKIEYTVIEGIYWNGGYNKNIGELAKHLHLERCKYKKTNTALGNVLKLLMNSIYGKTIMKKSNERSYFITKNKFDDYIYNNFGLLKEYEVLTDYRYKVVLKDFDAGYSLNHCGVSILSMSKRIMNEVFYIMDEYKLPMYYTDTDSIHMNDADVEILGKEFKKVFGRDLIGKHLGQFHSDFDMKGSKTDPVSVWNVSLGPKCYMDVLEGKDEHNKTIYDTHIRLKGITQAGIDNKIKEYDAKDYINGAKKLYTDLSKGNSVEFTLNPVDKVMFEYVSGGITTRKCGEFKRVVKF